MVTVNHAAVSGWAAEGANEGKNRVVNVLAMDHGDSSDPIQGAGWQEMKVVAKDGGSAVNGTGVTDVQIEALYHGTGTWVILPEVAGVCVFSEISTGGVVTAGYCTAVPAVFRVTLNDAGGTAAAGWDVQVQLKKKDTHDRGKG